MTKERKTTLPSEDYEIVNDLTFDQIKEYYCPQCYFDDDKKVLRKDCQRHKPQPTIQE